MTLNLIEEHEGKNTGLRNFETEVQSVKLKATGTTCKPLTLKVIFSTGVQINKYESISISIQCIQEEKKLLCIWYGVHRSHRCIQRSCHILPIEIETLVDKFKNYVYVSFWCINIGNYLSYNHADSKNKFNAFIMAFLIGMINNKITHLK